MIWDLSKCPPTIGDTVAGLIICRVASAMGANVTFRVDESKGLRSDWSDESTPAKDELVQTWKALFEMFRPHTLQGAVDWLFLEGDELLTGKTKAATERLILNPKNPIYEIAPLLLNRLWGSLKLDDAARAALLLDNIGPSDEELERSGLRDGYVAWHVRNYNYGLERNLTRSEIVASFTKVSHLFPGKKVMIMATDSTARDVVDLLRESTPTSKLSENLVLQPNPGFASATKWVLGSKCYIQELGGGMGVIALHSNIPYLITMYASGSYPKPLGVKIMAWASPDQHYFLLEGGDRGGKRAWEDFAVALESTGRGDSAW